MLARRQLCLSSAVGLFISLHALRISNADQRSSANGSWCDLTAHMSCTKVLQSEWVSNRINRTQITTSAKLTTCYEHATRYGRGFGLLPTVADIRMPSNSAIGVVYYALLIVLCKNIMLYIIMIIKTIIRIVRRSIWCSTRSMCPPSADRTDWRGQHDDTVFGLRAGDGVAQPVFGVCGDLCCERCEFACDTSDVSNP